MHQNQEQSDLNKKQLDRSDVLGMDIYRDVWMPLDNKGEDIRQLVKRGSIPG